MRTACEPITAGNAVALSTCSTFTKSDDSEIFKENLMYHRHGNVTQWNY